MNPYCGLAPYYDRVMEHVDYERWQQLILAIHKRFPLPNRRVLESGGGTGRLAELFEGSDFTWYCSDRCFDMALQARRRLKAPVWVQNGCHPSVRKGFGLAVFLYDGINYLLKREDFVACISAMMSVLKTGGYFLFDVTTETNSLRHFVDYKCSEDVAGCHLVRHSTYNKKTRIQMNRFDFFERRPSGLHKIATEKHEQNVYSLDTIQSMIADAGPGIELAGMWDGFGFRPATGNSERVHFFLRKT